MSEPFDSHLAPAPGTPPGISRLGKNLRGYQGETIDIAEVLGACAAAARAAEWKIEELHPAPMSILAFSRRGATAGGSSDPLPDDAMAGSRRRRVYLSTGIHGDEPAGPLAVLQLLRENRWPAGLDLWLCPCLNPKGFVQNRRENSEGLDLNRQFREPKAKETLVHIEWLQAQPNFDLCLCLHEDWEAHGFYLYELNPDDRPSLARALLEQAGRVCPIDRSAIIEGRPAQDGLIRPSLDPRTRPDWPEAFFLLTHKTRLSYTVEAPSDFALPVRVAALVAAVNAALGAIGR